jgi:hypothetical protein
MLKGGRTERRGEAKGGKGEKQGKTKGEKGENGEGNRNNYITPHTGILTLFIIGQHRLHNPASSSLALRC